MQEKLQEKTENENTEKTLKEKLSSKIKDINKKLENENYSKNTYRIEVTEKNKVLHFNSNTRKELENAGLNLEKVEYNYISYKALPQHYDQVLAILTEYSDIFKKTEKVEKDN